MSQKTPRKTVLLSTIIIFLSLFQTNVALYGIGVEDTFFEKSEYGSVMSLAQRYVGFIQNIQSRGPYYLGKCVYVSRFEIDVG